MKIHFEILIDASGSMGNMQKLKDEENIYLLPDKSTRTELVKKILKENIIPKLLFTDSLTISTFSSKLILNDFGNPKFKDGKKQFCPSINEEYSGIFEKKAIENSINRLPIPDEAGTPLSWAATMVINKSKHDDIILIILSDGDDSEVKNFDELILKTIESKNVPCKIYFIGIDQNEEAEKKSKNLVGKTNGFYANLSVMDYDEKIFDSMLFEWNATMTSNALKESLRIESTIIKPITINTESVNEMKKIQINEPVIENLQTEVVEKTNDEFKSDELTEQKDLKIQVNENTKSLKLIASQLDTIVKEISYIRNVKTNSNDEFEANDDEALNRLIGNQTEKYLFDYLKKSWSNTKWLNENGEQGKPYDFEIIHDSISYYIECKGTTSDIKEFLLTKNEWQFYLQNRKNYRLYFVSEINSINPTIIRIEDLLIAMEESKLIPCSSVNRKVKADRILFKIVTSESYN